MLTRRDLLVSLITVSLTISAIAFAQSTARPMMPSRVFNWNSTTVETTKTGRRRALFDTPTLNLSRFECHITTLDGGEMPHASHAHPEEEMMIVKEGTLEVTQNGETDQVQTGGVIFCASNEKHGLRNIGTNRATYFVVKWFPHDLGKERP